MKHATRLSIAILAGCLLIVAGCGHKTAAPVQPPTEPAPAVQPPAPAAQEYTCPMHPEVRAAQPGKCPTCGMDLVPVIKPSAASQAGPTTAAASGVTCPGAPKAACTPGAACTMTSDTPAVAAVEPPAANTVCPVMEGNPIRKDLFVDYNGKRVYFCCPGCIPAFKADPGKYMEGNLR